MSERQKWRDMAKAMFTSFGDVIRSAKYQRKVLGSIDQNTGSYTNTPIEIDTSIVWMDRNRIILPDGENWEEHDRGLMLLGEKFVDQRPSNLDTIVVDNETFRIKTVMLDETGTGAYFVLRVGK